MFLYLESADATVRPRFLRYLTGPAALHYQAHASLETGIDRDLILRTLSRSWRGGQLTIVSDLVRDDYGESLQPVLNALPSICKQLGFTGSRTICEIAIQAPNEQKAVQVLDQVSRAFRGPVPYIHCYVLPQSGGTDNGNKTCLAAFLAAMALAFPSRMAVEGVNLGLTAVRNAERNQFFLTKLAWLTVPSTDKLASVALNMALLRELFSPAATDGRRTQGVHSEVKEFLRQRGIESEPHAEQLLRSLQRIRYRDHLLDELCRKIIRGVRTMDDFLTVLEMLAADYTGLNPALRDLLLDLKNAILAVRFQTEQDFGRYRGELSETTNSVATSEARVLMGKHEFSLWPLLDQQIRAEFTALNRDYQDALRVISRRIGDQIRQTLRSEERAIRASLGRIAMNEVDQWSLPPRTYPFVTEPLDRDMRDEIWQLPKDAAIVVMLERMGRCK